MNLLRFLFGELFIAIGSSARVLASLNAPQGVPTPYRGLAAGPAPLDPAHVERVVRIRRKIAAVYATLGLVIPMFVIARLAVVSLSAMHVDDAASIVVTIAVTVLLSLLIGGALSFGGLFIARPIVNAILKRAEQPPS
jgi:hypothetical protein